MNNLGSAATFRACAFQPTSQELHAATRRLWHKSSAKPGTSKLPVEEKKEVTSDKFVLRDLSDSEDDFPDPAAILKKMKLSKGGVKGTEKAKPNGDDVSGLSIVYRRRFTNRCIAGGDKYHSRRYLWCCPPAWYIQSTAE